MVEEGGVLGLPGHSQSSEGVSDGLGGQLERTHGVERGQLGDLGAEMGGSS